ncbi:hypothetical protein M8C21_009701 [Ambrosia artemisiifolia]|uniref:Uncharacterized protein n=1 Tax=Ambrosia artemisiifolia TaxID=4212 RepID=A0AAD5G7K6_AMBAR|nr:hypothetical protein M8C21_009701 [Ambrosia artemisiifolia]
MAALSSTENGSSVTAAENPMQYYLYPPPIAQYEDVIASPNLFMDILGKFHAAMGTKFKIPVVGGNDLDLHRLFVEVTSRGGLKKVLEEKKWRDVTNCFTFPPSATNASFILRKYYMSLVHHFEQVYYFKAKAWKPVPTDTWQSTKSTPTSTLEMNKSVLPLPEVKETSLKRPRTITEEDASTKGPVESSIGLPVTGVLDGKFESGYLCTVRIGGELLQGVLYQTVQSSLYDIIPKHAGQVTMDTTQGLTVVRCRRRRRKKSEMRKRDPAHPKPNRSGYNFFFAEQHARLKLLHTNKDRAISRMIGEEWNKLTESQKAVYQEKAVKDKERYRSEMENYREGFKRGKASNLDIEHKLSLNIEDYQVGQQKSMPVPQNGPLVFDNELTRIQENDLNRYKKTTDDEPMIPDINDGNKAKSADRQEQDFEMFDEHGLLVTNEQRDFENPG